MHDGLRLLLGWHECLLCLLGSQLGLALFQAFLQRLALCAHLVLEDLHYLLRVGFDLLELFGLALFL